MSGLNPKQDQNPYIPQNILYPIYHTIKPAHIKSLEGIGLMIRSSSIILINKRSFGVGQIIKTMVHNLWNIRIFRISYSVVWWCWWQRHVGDSVILVTLCWWQNHYVGDGDFSELNRSPSSKNGHQHISAPTSVSNTG